jgi:hypothetical protein
VPTARKRGSFEHVNSNDLWAIVQAGRWFRSLPPELTAQMQQLAQPRLLAAGEWLFRRGDAPAACMRWPGARSASPARQHFRKTPAQPC